MNDEKLKKATELQKAIQGFEAKIKDLEAFFSTGKNVHEFGFDFKKDKDVQIVTHVSFSKFWNEEIAQEIDACSCMVAGYMLEVLKARLNRLKEEYKNL